MQILSLLLRIIMGSSVQLFIKEVAMPKSSLVRLPSDNSIIDAMPVRRRGCQSKGLWKLFSYPTTPPNSMKPTSYMNLPQQAPEKTPPIHPKIRHGSRKPLLRSS
jgi:hypothetical protein